MATSGSTATLMNASILKTISKNSIHKMNEQKRLLNKLAANSDDLICEEIVKVSQRLDVYIVQEQRRLLQNLKL